MTETPQSAPASVLTKEQRSQIAKVAATRRWAKAKQEKEKLAKAAKSGKAKQPVSRSHKRPAGPREFSSALKAAEKRLAQAIEERAKAGNTYAIVSAEIPSLQRIIAALRNPMGAQYEAGVIAAPTLEQIVGDQPLGYQNPPLPMRPRGNQVSPSNLPPAAAGDPGDRSSSQGWSTHPVTSQGRAMGGAIGVAIQDDENENQFLETSSVAGGEWH